MRSHGPSAGPTAIVLHGGPGAPGAAAPLASALADPLRVLEPHQRWSSDEPLTVARHLDDLAVVVADASAHGHPALVGESWGAMLALAFAGRHPERIAGLALVGCGSFDESSRARLGETLSERTTPELAGELAALAEMELGDDERFARHHRLCDSLYTYRRVSGPEAPLESVDLKGHRESWADMLRLQAEGVYPQAFAAIRCPVLMLHGSYDPHPGEMIRDVLLGVLPHLEYREFDLCGHSPWVEEHAREEFLVTARAWLEATTGAAQSRPANATDAL